MGIINVLEPQIANLIAAGEVVDRPASAVKELAENAIDAGASRVTVEIKNGGVSLIRVTDDGCGMSAEDAKLCILRHATSKIKAETDLNGICTLGFRGEALAAICSVSRFRILTRKAELDVGTLLLCEAGKILSVEEVGCPVGTTVTVEDLFENVPARRKFLKRDASETAAVAAVVEKIALSRPDISFRFITDGSLRFQTAGDGKLLNVIYSVLGRDFAKKTIPVDDMTEGIAVSGFIGSPENCRGNRNYENFFINGRYVKCQTALAATEQAFSSYIPSDRFPCCVLNIQIFPAFVDVNVHPQKMEVKFSNDRPVFNAVYCAVRNTLASKIHRPEIDGPITTRLTGDSYRLYSEIISAKVGTEEEATAIADDRDRLSAKYDQITLHSTLRPEIPDDRSPDGVPAAPRDSRPGQNGAFSGGGADGKNFSTPFGASGNGAGESGAGAGISGGGVYRDGTAGKDSSGMGSTGLFGTGNGASATGSETGAGPSGAGIPGVGNGTRGVGIGADGERKSQKETPVFEDSPFLGEEEPNISLPPLTSRGGGFSSEENGREAVPGEPLPLPWYRIAGVVFNCYIFVELTDSMLIIDKHAAHERILFEKMKQNMKTGDPAAQLLIIPLILRISPPEYAALCDFRTELEKIGFAFAEGEERNTVAILQHPSALSPSQSGEMLLELAASLAAGTGDVATSRDRIYEKALYQASCKAAVKGGREDLPETVRWIAEQVLTRPEIKFCPHGRPVAFEMTKKQFEQRFERS